MKMSEPKPSGRRVIRASRAEWLAVLKHEQTPINTWLYARIQKKADSCMGHVSITFVQRDAEMIIQAYQCATGREVGELAI